MTPDPEAADLRGRAAVLRSLAGRLDDARLLTLHRWAGDDTWTSPRAEQLRTQLAGDRARIIAAAGELRDQARRLERRAEAIEAATAAVSG